MTTIEHKLDETLIIDNSKYKVVKDTKLKDCYGCDLYLNNVCHFTKEKIKPLCYRHNRSDKNDIIYKKKSLATGDTISRESNLNMMIKINGIEISLIDLCKQNKVSYVVILERLKQGISIEDALAMPIQKEMKKNAEGKHKGRMPTLYKIDGIYKTINEWCKIYNISRATVESRMRNRNFSLEDALKSPKQIFCHKENKVQDRLYATIDGRTQDVRSWCLEFGINARTVYSRKGNGMTIEDALLAALPKGRKVKEIQIGGVSRPIRDLSEEYNINFSTIQYRLKKGMSVEDAVCRPVGKQGRKKKKREDN